LPLQFLWKFRLEGERRELFWPLPPPARTAVLMDGFRLSAGVRAFREEQKPQLVRYRPDALAGPVSRLRKLAEGAEDRGSRVPRLTHSVIAFIILKQAFLSEEARETLWRVFKVPVFGQILGLNGELLAWECEAHEGFHIQPECAAFEISSGQSDSELLATSLAPVQRRAIRLPTGLTGRIEDSSCACGLKSPRLVQVRRLPMARPVEVLR
jgi:phenylacetate-coenzyme A ligase PaaK-like adenylate-forming protein